MGLYRALYALALLFVTLPAFTQDPCKTAAMQGYTGNCKVSVMHAVDGKHFYTSDGSVLKKWDLKTFKVVEEYPNFPFHLLKPTSDPDVLEVQHEMTESFYSIKEGGKPNFKRLIEDKEMKIPSKYSYPTAFGYDPELKLILVKANSGKQIIKVDLANGNKTSVVYSGDYGLQTPAYFPELHWMAYWANDFIYVVDIKTGKELAKFKSSFQEPDYFASSPDNKYIALNSERQSHIFEKATGKYLGSAGDGKGQVAMVHWKSSGEGFYFSATGHACQYGENCLNQLAEYTLPGIKLIAKHFDEYNNRVGTFVNFLLNADEGRLYLSYKNSMRSYEFSNYAIANHDDNKRVVLGYTASADVAKQEADDKAERMKIFNKMIEKLFELTVPTHFHTFGQSLSPEAVSANGDLLIKEHDQVFHWRFPEGKPVALYTARGAALNGTGPLRKIVPAGISKAFISPSGTDVGLNYDNQKGFEIFRNGNSICKGDTKRLIALLDGKALVAKPWKFGFVVEGLELIETTTGNVLHKIPRKLELTFIDATTVTGKVFLTDEKIWMFDLVTHALTSHTWEEAKKIGFYLPVGVDAPAALKNKAYPGMKKGDVQVFQGRYFLTHSKDEGFNIYDLLENKNVNAKPIHSNWDRFHSMAYLPQQNKLVVWSDGPEYSRPNALENEPGASAFTVDVSNGAITPYLLHGDRPTIIATAKMKNAKWAAFESNACAYAEHQLPTGALFTEKNGEMLLKVGTDCSDSAHVMVRVKPTDAGKDIFRVTFEKWDFEKNKTYSGYNAFSKWKLCPECGGFPQQQVTEYYTGWSAWEQTNFNIYSRRWVKNQKSTGITLCSTCHGKAIVKM